MCLDVLTKRYKKPSTKEVVGYKMFEYAGDKIHFPYYGLHGRKEVPRGRWLESSYEKIRFDWVGPASDVNCYPSGFHVFAKKSDAIARACSYRKVVKVRLRGIVAKGKENGRGVIVAREMFVPKLRKTK